MKKLLLSSLFSILTLGSMQGSDGHAYRLITQHAAQPAQLPAAQAAVYQQPNTQGNQYNQNAVVAKASQAKNQYVHTPAQGPLNFNFRAGNVLFRAYTGAIIDTILKTPELSQELFNALNNIFNVSNMDMNDMQRIFRSGELTYAQLVQILQEERSANRYKVFFVLEKALIKLHQEHAYWYTLPTNNYFIQSVCTGFRNPLSLIDDTAEMNQILQELDNLAAIITRHYPGSGLPMQGRIALLRHWRKTTIITTAATFFVCKKVASLFQK